MNRQTILEAIYRERLVAIVRGVEKSRTLAAVQALYGVGVRLVEVTCNTADAMSIIHTLRETYGDRLFVGAGTVLGVEDVRQAKAAGAGFILSPDTDVAVIGETRALDMVSVPGALTATEVRTAVAAGADIVKIFPAGPVGPGYIKDLLAPLNDVALMAVGGVNLDNVAAYLRAGAMSVGVGSSLLNKDLLAANDMAGLADLGKKFMTAISRI